jgi:FixJ family two-component response regulator
VQRSADVLPTTTPADALELAADPGRRIDVLLVDLGLPGMNGWELAKRLVARRPGLRVICMSGYLDTSLVDEDLPGPGVTFLAKPVAPDVLVRAVGEARVATAPG